MGDPATSATVSHRDRRRCEDFWVRFLEWLVVGSWFLLFIALLVFSKARPQIETFFERYYNLPVNPDWNLDFLFYLRILMILGLSLSVLGLTINWRRSRRADDQCRVSLVILGAISLLGLFSLYIFN